MRLHTITLVNCGVYRHHSLDFQYGVTGFTGAGGSGKTTIARAVEFIIRNKVSGKITKSELLNWEAKEKGEKGYVEMVFSHDLTKYVLRRNLHNSSCSLKWDDQARKKASEVDEMMRSILQRDPDIFAETSIIEQGCLNDVLKMTHAKRMEYLQRITGASVAEVIRQQVNAFINQIPVTPDRTPERISMEGEIKGLKSDLVTQEASLKEYQGKSIYPDPKQYDNDVCFLRMPTVEETQDSIQKHVAYQGQLLGAQNALKQKHNIPEVALEQIVVSEADTAKRDRHNWRESLLKNLQGYTQQVSLLQVPPKPKVGLVNVGGVMVVPTIETQQWTETVTAATKAVAELNIKIEHAHKGVCTECGRAFEGVTSADIPALNTIREQWLQKSREAAEAIQRTNNQILHENNAWGNYTNSKEQLDRNIAEVNTQLQQFPDEGFNEELYQAIVLKASAYNNYLQRMVQYESENKDLVSKMAQSKSSVEHLTNTAQISTVDKGHAQQRITYHEQWLKGETNIKNNIERLKATIPLKEKWLEGVVKEEEESRRITQAVGHLNNVRESLHRDKIPKVVMARILRKLNYKIEHYLMKFNLPFTIYITEDFDILADFHHQKEVPVKMLSGKQMCGSSLAVVFALSEMFGGSLPLLILDESTYGLDKEGVRDLVDVLMEVRKIAEKGSYIFMITHEESLQTAFTTHIRVGEQEEGKK